LQGTHKGSLLLLGTIQQLLLILLMLLPRPCVFFCLLFRFVILASPALSAASQDEFGTVNVS